MTIYNNFITFKILNIDINIISDQTNYGTNTVAEINDKYFYLGNQDPNVLAAIFAWEIFSGKSISDKDFAQALEDNQDDLSFLDIDNQDDDD